MSEDTSASPELAELRSKVDSLSENIKQLGGMFSTMLGHIQKPAEPEPQPAAKDEITWPAADELEAMPRDKHTELVFRNMAKFIEQSVLKPLRDEIQSVRGEVHQTGALSALEKAQAAHPDFNDFSEEIKAELKDMRVPDLEKAYKLARLVNPKKAAELDAKYSPAGPSDDNDFDLASYLPARPGKSSSGPVVGGMSIAEAAAASFNKLGPSILKSMGGEPA